MDEHTQSSFSAFLSSVSINSAIDTDIFKQVLLLHLMVSVTRLMSAAVGAALLNKEIRQAVISSLTKSANDSKKPNSLQTLIEGALALVLLRWTRGSWIAQPAAISAIAALLAGLAKSNEGPNVQKERIIDIDDYTVVDEK
jgi:hypothetical protein